MRLANLKRNYHWQRGVSILSLISISLSMHRGGRLGTPTGVGSTRLVVARIGGGSNNRYGMASFGSIGFPSKLMHFSNYPFGRVKSSFFGWALTTR